MRPARKLSDTSERGRRAEALACTLLRREGMRVEAVNVRFPVGELDIVAWEGTTLCVVEVRCRSSEAFGGPLGSVTRQKQRRMIRAAQWYLKRRALNPDAVRFDVVAIRWGAGGAPAMELIKGAFTAD